MLDLIERTPTQSETGYRTADAWLESDAFALWVRVTLPAGTDPAEVRASLRERFGRQPRDP